MPLVPNFDIRPLVYKSFRSSIVVCDGLQRLIRLSACTPFLPTPPLLYFRWIGSHRPRPQAHPQPHPMIPSPLHCAPIRRPATTTVAPPPFGTAGTAWRTSPLPSREGNATPSTVQATMHRTHSLYLFLSMNLACSSVVPPCGPVVPRAHCGPPTPRVGLCTSPLHRPGPGGAPHRDPGGHPRISPHLPRCHCSPFALAPHWDPPFKDTAPARWSPWSPLTSTGNRPPPLVPDPPL
jgi:hypothetical protein